MSINCILNHQLRHHHQLQHQLHSLISFFSLLECSQKNKHSNVCLKFYCIAKFLTHNKIFWSKKSVLYLYILELFTFECTCLLGLHIKEEKRQRQGGVHWWATFVWWATVYSIWEKVPVISNLNLCFSGAQ